MEIFPLEFPDNLEAGEVMSDSDKVQLVPVHQSVNTEAPDQSQPTLDFGDGVEVPSADASSTRASAPEVTVATKKQPPEYKGWRVVKTAQSSKNRSRAWQSWREQHEYIYLYIVCFATYLALATALIIGYHWFAVLIVWAASGAGAALYVFLVAIKWADQWPSEEQMKRRFNNNKSCRIAPRLVPRVMACFQPNPITGDMNEFFVRLQLRAKWWLIRRRIVHSLLGVLIVTALSLLHYVLPMLMVVGIELLYLLFAACSMALISQRYESVFHILTNFRFIAMNLPSPWLFWKDDYMPSAPIDKVDFSKPRRPWWSRLFHIDTGRFTGDTPASADLDLNNVKDVSEVYKFGGEAAELQLALRLGLSQSPDSRQTATQLAQD